jgi:hypothetical protein
MTQAAAGTAALLVMASRPAQIAALPCHAEAAV